MFASKPARANLLAWRRNKTNWITALTLITIAVAIQAILCSGDGVKGKNINNNAALESKSSPRLRSPVNVARLQSAKSSGYKTTTFFERRPGGEKVSSLKKPKPAGRRTLSGRVANQDQDAEHQSVVPSLESNGNSQVVYVNLARVVAEQNETSRVISKQPIKQDGQIGCGETNRDGVPSSVPSNETLQNRIVGGNKAEPGEYPYQVRLNIRSRRGSSLCGGVIIDKRHILTAAHCMTTCSSYFVSTSTIDPASVQATIGDLRITVSDGEQQVGIEKVTAHQSYSACSYSHNNYDIAILKTNRPMSWVFTKDGFGSVNRVCLPHPGDDYEPGENATVSGWGVMSEGEGSISNVLNAVEVPIVSNRECRAAYGQRVNQDHVCAGLKEGGKDSCQGDSGGPLVRTRKGKRELIGIVSFGYGCARSDSPGVYTKVSSYIDWIQKNL